MIPGDDQLIELGEDSTVSVSKALPSESQRDIVEKVSVLYSGDGESRKLSSCILSHRQTIVTRYTVKNNGSRSVPCLYIEHTARVDRGGFAIKSTDKCVKQVTGWARYCLAVGPDADVQLEVEEEATYEENLRVSDDSIAQFLSVRGPELCKKGVVEDGVVEALQEEQERQRLSTLLNAFARPAGISEEQLLSWEQRNWGNDRNKVRREIEELLGHVRKLLRLEVDKKELQRKQSVANTRVQKIFENQARLRENIKSMEHVRTGSLLDRYMNDMDKEESDLIETRKKIEEAEELIATNAQESSKLTFQISMDAKKIQKRCYL